MAFWGAARGFAYPAGEDPYLGYTMIQPAVRGIQEQGVIANGKHYILNNMENNRWFVSAFLYKFNKVRSCSSTE